jgi:hypothetical protein
LRQNWSHDGREARTAQDRSLTSRHDWHVLVQKQVSGWHSGVCTWKNSLSIYVPLHGHQIGDAVDFVVTLDGFGAWTHPGEHFLVVLGHKRRKLILLLSLSRYRLLGTTYHLSLRAQLLRLQQLRKEGCQGTLTKAGHEHFLCRQLA